MKGSGMEGFLMNSYVQMLCFCDARLCKVRLLWTSTSTTEFYKIHQWMNDKKVLQLMRSASQNSRMPEGPPLPRNNATCCWKSSRISYLIPEAWLSSSRLSWVCRGLTCGKNFKSTEMRICWPERKPEVWTQARCSLCIKNKDIRGVCWSVLSWFSTFSL